MSSETNKAKARLAVLSNSFSELEIHLEPLLSQTLPETLLPLEPIQQAKLQTLLSYVTYDLIFIYLKSRGVDPKTHPIVSELDRIKQYFDKIDKAENSDTKRHEIDKAAAGRFIKHAITQAKLAPSSTKEGQDANAGPSVTTRVPLKVTSKMLEREQHQKEMRERDEAEGSEDDGLEFVGEEPEAKLVDIKGKGKAKGDAQAPVAGTKRRRLAMDPFAASGITDEQPAASQESPVPESSTPSAAKPTKKKQKTKETSGAAKVKKAKKKKTS